MWKWFKRWIWTPLGHILRVRTIIELCGIKGGAGVLIAIAVSVWAFIKNIPGPFIAVAAPFACGNTIWILDLLSRRRETETVETHCDLFTLAIGDYRTISYPESDPIRIELKDIVQDIRPVWSTKENAAHVRVE